jgi:hypothetical protein
LVCIVHTPIVVDFIERGAAWPDRESGLKLVKYTIFLPQAIPQLSRCDLLTLIPSQV